MKPRVLVAGMGNDLRQDDGFGIAVVRRLAERGVPAGVRLYEAGIAGIGLVQELMDGYDAVIIVDVVDRGGEPGTVYLLEADVPDLDVVSDERRRELLADMHQTLPSAAFLLGRALDALPPRCFVLGCQPEQLGLGMQLSASVEAAIPDVLHRLHALASELVAQPVAAGDGLPANMGV
jgi:hydrogenase maturation protease